MTLPSLKTPPNLMILDMLADEEILSRVRHLARYERVATAALVAHLAILDARGLYVPLGYSSLFRYCTAELHFSEQAAYSRIRCARAVRRFPVILELLAAGKIHLTAVRLLAPHLTGENHRALLARATHLGQREVEQLVAELDPLPPAPSTIRKLPTCGTLPLLEAAPLSMSTESTARQVDGTTAAPAHPADVNTTTTIHVVSMEALDPAQSPANSGRPRHNRSSTRHRATTTPLAPNLYRVQFTANQDTHDKLTEAQELLRHQIPSGDIALVIDRALTDLVLALRRRKFGALKNSRAREASPCYPHGRPAPCPRGTPPMRPPHP